MTNCTGGCWHPTDKTTVLTCSEDGTLRVWDAKEVRQKTVIKPQVCKAAEGGQAWQARATPSLNCA